MIHHLGKTCTAEEFAALPDSALAGSPAFPHQTKAAQDFMVSETSSAGFKSGGLIGPSTLEAMKALELFAVTRGEFVMRDTNRIRRLYPKIRGDKP